MGRHRRPCSDAIPPMNAIHHLFNPLRDAVAAIFKRDLYDYATVLKYEVVKLHRGELKGGVIYVGHYNPWKPRGEAADRRVKDIGGNLRQCQVHKDDTALHNVYTQVGMNAGKNQTCHKRCQQKHYNFHATPSCVTFGRCKAPTKQ